VSDFAKEAEVVADKILTKNIDKVEERVVRFSVRTVLTVIGLVIAAWALLTYEAETAPP
jgi:ABC-type transporter lipoprotein component MlaA